MNIWDPIWKEDKEDSDINELVYKMKPVVFNLERINCLVYGSKGSYLLSTKVHFDIVFKEDYINTLDVDKRKVWVVDDGGCVVTMDIDNPSRNAVIEYVNKLNQGPAQRHWVAKRIKRGIRLELDLPRYSCYSPLYDGYISIYWTFGTVKLLVPEPMQIDSTTIETDVGFTIQKLELTSVRPMGDFLVPKECYQHSTNTIPYQILKKLNLFRPDMVTIDKFTIESSKNLVNEIKDIVSVPMDSYNINYIMEDNPDIPIRYARSSNANKSIGSSSRPKDNCSKKVDPSPKTDQTQFKGRSLTSLGIVGKILSIIKRRKREIK